MKRTFVRGLALVALIHPPSLFADETVPCAKDSQPNEISFLDQNSTKPIAPTGPLIVNAARSVKAPTVYRVAGMRASAQLITLFRRGDETEQVSGVLPVTDETPSGQQLSAADQVILTSLGLDKSPECSHEMAAAAEDSNLDLISYFVDDDAVIDAARREYLADPERYKQKYPVKAEVLRKHVELWRNVLQKCFTPANNAPEFASTNASSRLGFISLNGKGACLAYLVSRDHILTARHCIYHDDATTQVYRNGHATFSPVSDGNKHYQVCAVAGSLSGRSGDNIADEQVVLRIADTSQTGEGSALFDATSVRGLADKIHLQQPTKLLIFTWVPHASEFDARYTGDIAFRTGPGSDCIVMNYDQKAQCFTHFCPTYRGTSGSPIFADAGGAWRLLGVHAGVAQPTDDAYAVCTAAPESTANTGVVLNKNSLSQFSKQTEAGR